MFLKQKQNEKGVWGNLFHHKQHQKGSRGNAVFLVGFCINIVFCPLLIAESSFSASDSANIEQIEGLVNDLRLHMVNIAPQADISVDGTIWHHVWNIDAYTQDILEIINKKFGTNQQDFPFYIYQIFNAINSFKTSFDDFVGPNGFIPSIYNTELSIDSTLKSSNTKLDNILSSSDSVKDAIDNWQDNYLNLFQVINEYLPKIEDRETRASILSKVDEINNYIPLINSFLGEITTSSQLSQSTLQSIYNLLNSKLGSGLTEDVSQIADDISVIRNTQLPYIYSQVGEIGSNTKYIRDNWESKLDNLDIIAKALSGFSSDGTSPNLGFESIGKNVELLTHTSVGISNEVSRLSSAIRKAEGLSYMLVSNIAYSSPVYTNIFNITNAPLASLDLSIITNAILGSSYLNGFHFSEGTDYFSLYDKYASGEIDFQTYISGMGIWNWFYAMTVGDIFVDIPGIDNPDNIWNDGWTTVVNAQQNFHDLSTYSSFYAQPMANAKYFLYGTRDLTDNSTNLVYLSDIEKNTVSNALLLSRIAFNTASNALYLSKIDKNTMSNTYYLSRSYQVAVSNMNVVTSIYNILKNWNEDEEELPTDTNLTEPNPEFEENPEEIEEENAEITSILNSSIDESALDASLDVINRAQSAFNYSVGGSAKPLVIKADVGVLGGSIPIEITIESLQRFSSFWETIVKFLTAGFKIATILIVTRATIKTFLSDMKEIELW